MFYPNNFRLNMSNSRYFMSKSLIQNTLEPPKTRTTYNKRQDKILSCLLWWALEDLSCSLAFNGNFAFCFQRFHRFQTKALQPQLVRAELQNGSYRQSKLTIKKSPNGFFFMVGKNCNNSN